MSNVPLVSIILPLYNKRPFVRRALRSVIGQTYQHWELIVVDDGSTDGSELEIPLDEPRIRLIRQANRGPAAARNRGIAAASGSYIAFIDADDWYYPHKLETEVKLLWREKRADWMVSGGDQEFAGAISPSHFSSSGGERIGTDLLVCRAGLKEVRVEGWTADGLFLDSSLIAQAGGFNEQMKCYEIFEFAVRCIVARPEVLVYSKPLYRVVDVPGSTFKQSRQRIVGERLLGEALLEMATRHSEFAPELETKGRECVLSYATQEIFSGNGGAARRYLAAGFPLRRDGKWWKLWLASWGPSWLYRRIYHDAPPHGGCTVGKQ